MLPQYNYAQSHHAWLRGFVTSSEAEGADRISATLLDLIGSGSLWRMSRTPSKGHRGRLLSVYKLPDRGIKIGTTLRGRTARFGLWGVQRSGVFALACLSIRLTGFRMVLAHSLCRTIWLKDHYSKAWMLLWRQL